MNPISKKLFKLLTGKDMPTKTPEQKVEQAKRNAAFDEFMAQNLDSVIERGATRLSIDAHRTS